jgi:4-amino-4-deoxy-L-arabinose transferase-like glycosyltransferase
VSDSFKSIFRTEWPASLLFLLALGLRIYRLGTQPLWLDEIYAVQLVHEGPLAILRNSLIDPHPPLFYLFQWLASGFGAAQSEWGWRWLSMLSGALTVPLLYLLCRRFSGRQASALAGLALAVSPVHVYYSQEARSYAFVTLLAVWSTLLIAQILSDPGSLRRWVALAVLSLVGLYSSYFYMLIIGVQGLTLFLYTRHRGWWLYASLIAIGGAIAGWMMVPTLANQVQKEISIFLTPLVTLQSLAGERSHFSLGWQHWWLASIVGGLAFFGTLNIMPQVNKSRLEFYLAIQVVLSILFIFGVLPAMGVGLPLYQSRQLLILIPALFGMMALGIDLITKHLGWFIPALLGGAILVASGAGLQAYRNSSKSPEGSLAQGVRSEIQVGEVIVSLHYSLTAGVYAYIPEADMWVYREQDSNGYQFDREQRLYQIALLNPQPIAQTTLENIRHQPRFWVLNRADFNSTVLTALTDRCTQANQISFHPFDASLWENCQP